MIYYTLINKTDVEPYILKRNDDIEKIYDDIEKISQPVLLNLDHKLIHVFLTGSTGTVGKQILNKLLKTANKYIIHDFVRNKSTLPQFKDKVSLKFKINNKKSDESITNIELDFYEDKNNYTFYTQHVIGQDGLENDLYFEQKVLSKVKLIAGSDNPLTLKDKQLLNENPNLQYKENKDKDFNYIFINCAMDKDGPTVRANMRRNKITDVRKHWSINVASQLSKVTNYHFIKLIHLSTVYVNKGDTPINGWAPTKVVLGDPPSIDDDYIYGYAKAYAENVIMANDPCATIIRLPGIYDTSLKPFDIIEGKQYYLLSDILYSSTLTSPTMVIKNLLLNNKLTQIPLKSLILEGGSDIRIMKRDTPKIEETKKQQEQNIQKLKPLNLEHKPTKIFTAPYMVDHSQVRYPISAQQIATFIINYIDCVKEAELHQHTINIINYGGMEEITKYMLATKFYEKYNTIFNRLIVPTTTNTFKSVPQTEKMCMEMFSLPSFCTNIKDYPFRKSNILEDMLNSFYTIFPEIILQKILDTNRPIYSYFEQSSPQDSPPHPPQDSPPQPHHS